MPKSRSKNPPAAKKSKRMLHALYMVQPFLQFAALMAVLFVLGRCSPLSPSSDKSRLKSISENGAIAVPTERGEDAATEEAIKQTIHDVSENEEMPVISQSAYAEYIALGLHADKPADAARVKQVFQQRNREIRRLTRVLVLPLSAEEKARLVQGSVRIDLSRRLSSSMDAGTQKLLFSLLRDQPKPLKGKVFLVLSDEAMGGPEAVTAIPMHTKLRLAVLPGEERAFLQLNRADAQLNELQQELIRSNLERSVELAVVLE